VKRLHAATVRLSQPGGRQEMFPKISSANRRSDWAIRAVDLFGFERSSGVFMRGIRAPRENLSGKLSRRISATRVRLAQTTLPHRLAWGIAPRIRLSQN
jgi:hypothetical protein